MGIFESLLKIDYGGALLLLPGRGLGPGSLGEAGLVQRLRACQDGAEVEVGVLGEEKETLETRK